MSVDLARNALLLIYPSAGEAETHAAPTGAKREHDGAKPICDRCAVPQGSWKTFPKYPIRVRVLTRAPTKITQECFKKRKERQ